MILDRSRFNQEMQEALKKTDKINIISLEEMTRLVIFVLLDVSQSGGAGCLLPRY